MLTRQTMLTRQANRDIYKHIVDCFQETCPDLGINPLTLPSYTAFMAYETYLNLSRKSYVFYDPNIGCVALRPKKGGCMEVKWLCVSQEKRHRGYGQLLLDHCSTFARARGYCQLSLGCYAGNKRLVEWYQTHGFERKKTKGRKQDICFMTKKL